MKPGLRVGDFYQSAETVNGVAFDFLERHANSRFFLFLHYMDPHDPYFEHPYDGTGIARVSTPHPEPEPIYDFLSPGRAPERPGRAGAGALRGAAAGAVIGEIADDDAGKGAAWGAALGTVRGRRKSHQHADQQSAQAEQQYQQTVQYTSDQIENFKKAFSVCLEANDYMVKY